MTTSRYRFSRRGNAAESTAFFYVPRARALQLALEARSDHPVCGGIGDVEAELALEPLLDLRVAVEALASEADLQRLQRAGRQRPDPRFRASRADLQHRV
jgi:hypothetical protein